MSDRNFKEIRKQLRTVVKEQLKEVLNEEFALAMRKTLAEQLGKRMDEISESARKTLESIDTRNKDFQSYVVKEISKSTPLPTLEPEVKTQD
jgi:hypothetical protein